MNSRPAYGSSGQPRSQRDDLMTRGDGSLASPTNVGYDDMSHTDNRAMLQQQRDIMGEQDRVIDAIGESVVRTKEIAVAIGNEVDDQVKLIDKVGRKVDNTDGKLMKATDDIRQMKRKASNNIMLGTMCALIAILILVVFLAIFL
ncbi:syntaxin 8 [Pelomyxa schiedti]|nr:syntaxin 8 [Pelomyxa schiedti]